MPGQATRRHPEVPPYRCFFSDLAGFEGFCRAGPTRSGWSVQYFTRDVKELTDCLVLLIYWKLNHPKEDDGE